MSQVRLFYVCFSGGMTIEHRPEDPSNLASLQALVGGDLERYNCSYVKLPGFWVWFNQMPNRKASIPHQTPFCPYPLYGDFFVTKEKGDKLLGVTKAEFKKLSTLMRLFSQGLRAP